MSSLSDILSSKVGTGAAKNPTAPRQKPAVVNKKVSLPSPVDMAKGLRNYLLGEAQNFSDTTSLALDAATFGGKKQLEGIGHGITEFLQGGSFSEGHASGKAAAEGKELAARDRLGPLQSLAADLVGSATPGTGPARLGKMVEGAVNKGAKATGFFPRVAAGLKELGVQGAIGASEGFLNSIMDNASVGADFISTADATLGESFLDTTGGFFNGVAGHAILGRLVPMAARYGIGPSTVTARDRVADAILDTGPGNTGARHSGMTPETIRAQYPNWVANDTNLLDTGAGNVSAADATNRLTNAIARTSFRKTDFASPEGINDGTAEYMRTLGHVQDLITETQDNITRNFDEILGPPRNSSSRRGKDTAAKTAAASKMYESLGSPVPGKLGARMNKYRTLERDLNERVAMDATNSNLKDITKADASVQAVMNDALNELRPVVKRPHTGGTQIAPDISTREPDSLTVDLDTAEIPTAQILSARKRIAEKYKAGQLLNGTPVSPSTSRATAIVLKNLDRMLAARTFGKSDKARAEFASYMREKDAEEIGAAFYDRKLSEDETFGMSMAEFMDANRESPNVVTAFKDGYKSAFRAEMDNTDAMVTMSNLIGELPKGATPADIQKVKSRNLDNLRLVLGDNVADRLLTEFTNDSAKVAAKTTLEAMLRAKQYDPAAINDVLNAMDPILQAHGVGPGQASIFATSTMGALSRELQSMGVKDSDMLLALSGNTGRAAVDSMEGILRTAETPSYFNMGKTGEAIGGEVPDEPEDQEAQSTNAIMDYLTSIRQQPAEQ